MNHLEKSLSYYTLLLWKEGYDGERGVVEKSLGSQIAAAVSEPVEERRDRRVQVATP